MNLLLLNLLLAIGWSAVRGEISLGALTGGFVVGYLALWLTRPLYGQTRYFDRVIRVVGLLFFFVYELLVSSLRVARAVLTPRPRLRPGIVAVPLEARTDLEILAVANLISLTPGSLSLDLSDDRSTLFVHDMFVADPAVTREVLKTGLERRLLEVLR